jgi:hypothetical protein
VRAKAFQDDEESRDEGQSRRKLDPDAESRDEGQSRRDLDPDEESRDEGRSHRDLDPDAGSRDEGQSRRDLDPDAARKDLPREASEGVGPAAAAARHGEGSRESSLLSRGDGASRGLGLCPGGEESRE